MWNRGKPRISRSRVAYGSDRPGLVARMATVLADHGVNVTDLSCRLVGDDSPVDAMAAELAVPPGTDGLDAAVAAVAADMDVDGRSHVYRMEGFEARAAQHELDHLDGLFILDRLRSADDLYPRRTYR